MPSIKEFQDSNALLEALNEDQSLLLERISGVDGTLDELFDTGSVTVNIDGQAYIISLMVGKDDEPADGHVGSVESGCSG